MNKFTLISGRFKHTSLIVDKMDQKVNNLMEDLKKLINMLKS